MAKKEHSSCSEESNVELKCWRVRGEAATYLEVHGGGVLDDEDVAGAGLLHEPQDGLQPSTPITGSVSVDNNHRSFTHTQTYTHTYIKLLLNDTPEKKK